MEKRLEQAPDGRLVTVPVKVPLPRGWKPGAFFPTSTNDSFFLLAGLLLMFAGSVLARRWQVESGAGHDS